MGFRDTASAKDTRHMVMEIFPWAISSEDALDVQTDPSVQIFLCFDLGRNAHLTLAWGPRHTNPNPTDFWVILTDTGIVRFEEKVNYNIPSDVIGSLSCAREEFESIPAFTTPQVRLFPEGIYKVRGKTTLVTLKGTDWHEFNPQERFRVEHAEEGALRIHLNKYESAYQMVVSPKYLWDAYGSTRLIPETVLDAHVVTVHPITIKSGFAGKRDLWFPKDALLHVTPPSNTIRIEGGGSPMIVSGDELRDLLTSFKLWFCRG